MTLRERTAMKGPCAAGGALTGTQNTVRLRPLQLLHAWMRQGGPADTPADAIGLCTAKHMATPRSCETRCDAAAIR